MPEGTTERSRQLLRKAATMSSQRTAVPKKRSVFDRLGAVVKSDVDNSEGEEDEFGDEPASAVPLRLRKSVSFASGTKESKGFDFEEGMLHIVRHLCEYRQFSEYLASNILGIH